MAPICKECGYEVQKTSPRYRNKKGDTICPACRNKYGDKGKNPEKYVPTQSNRRWLGLRTRMLLLFFFIPFILIMTTGYFFLEQLNRLSVIISDENTNVVTDIAESVISDKAYSVARQVKNYLDAHPDLQKEDFAKDPDFMKIAVQKVGDTGYSVLNNAPEGHEPWRVLAHPNPKLIGADILNAVKQKLSRTDYIGFKKMHDEAFRTQKVTVGYYRFLDDKKKYLAMVPVEGTDFWALSTTYIDEFTLPMDNLREKAINITQTTRRIVIWIIAVAAAIVALTAIIYGNILSTRITKLKNTADRISIGDMAARIETKDRDELGDLAIAVSRLKESIRLSLERLRHRTNSP